MSAQAACWFEVLWQETRVPTAAKQRSIVTFFMEVRFEWRWSGQGPEEHPSYLRRTVSGRQDNGF
jgi:hypothetical protein